MNEHVEFYTIECHDDGFPLQDKAIEHFTEKFIDFKKLDEYVRVMQSEEYVALGELGNWMWMNDTPLTTEEARVLLAKHIIKESELKEYKLQPK